MPQLHLQFLRRFVNGMVYYGVSLASDNLGGNMYRDFVLTSLVEIPANILVIVLGNRYVSRGANNSENLVHLVTNL